MNYATTYNYLRHNCPTKTAKAVIRPDRRVFPLDRTPQRHEGNPQRQTAIRTDRPFADGFLKSRFIPKLQVNKEQRKFSDEQIQQRERDFYRSLSQLAEHYGIVPTETVDYGYPYNLALAFRDTEKQLRQSPHIENFSKLKISENTDTGQVFLSVTETYYTGCQFYYVAIFPLFRMLKDPKHKQAGQLLLSVFSYLYRIANVPFYRQEDSYLYWQYDMLKEWATHDDDSEENREILSELIQAEWTGERMATKIFNKENLKYWEKRLKTFKAKDTTDSDIFLLSAKFFELFKKYPNNTVFKNATADWEETEYYYDDEETKITMDKYIGFIADNKGVLYDQLCETVNQEFSQYAELEEPTVITHFDGTPIGKDNLDFENRIFPLINELCYYLHQYNNKENE